MDEEEINDELSKAGTRLIKFKGNGEEISTDMFDVGRDTYEIPNMLYSPESIFSDNIATLDINFLNPNTYESVTGATDDPKAKSAASKLSRTIASWYKSFRNIALVGLLSVLIYLGIRILISSTAVDKAKYKESLIDWLEALCLVVFIHIIMAAILMLTDEVNGLFKETINQGYIVQVGTDTPFRTNLMGLIRFKVQSTDVKEVAGFAVMYIAILIYTGIFTFMYLKRFLYIAFFTMIAPLVALTYPIDKIGDGKAQAFNVWFREYTMNVIIQPVHLIIYTVFVTSAYDLAADNMIYALVAIGFLIPAEKFIKSMFGLNKAESTSGFGSFAGGALAMNALKSLSGGGSGKKSGGLSGNKSVNDEKDTSLFIPMGDAGKLNTITGSEYTSVEDTSVEERSREIDKERLEEQIADGQINQNELTDGQRELLNTQNTGNTQFDSNQAEREALEEKIADGIIYEADLTDEQRRLLGYPEKTETENYSNNNDNNKTDNAKQEDNNIRYKSTGKVISGLVSRGGKKVLRNHGKIIKGIAKFGGKTVGAVGGTMVGLAAGITTGDMSKTFQYTTLGATAGGALGAKAGNLVDGAVNVARGVRDTGYNMIDTWNEEKYGYEKVKEDRDNRKNKMDETKFMLDDRNHKKYRQMAADIGYSGDYEDLMKSAIDYKKAGVSDNMIKNALKVEAKEYEKGGAKIGQGQNHEKYVDVSAFMEKNNFDKSYIEDAKKRETLDNVLESTQGRARGYEAGKIMARLTDREDLYKEKSKLAPIAQKTKAKPKTNNSKSSTKKGMQNPHVKPNTIQDENTTNNS